jgi:hypothetical protein
LAFPSVTVHLPSVGFEIEYLSTFGQTTPGDYSAGGIFASLIVQPMTISNVRIFAVGGVGVWGEGFAGGKRTGVLNAAADPLCVWEKLFGL